MSGEPSAPGPAAPVRVLIVEDHAVFAELLAAWISRQPDLEVIGTARTAREGVSLAARTTPGIVLLDQNLPDAEGTTVVRELKREAPNVAVILLTGEDADDTLLAAAEAGADGYLLKFQPSSDVLAAVRRAVRGERTFDAATIGRLYRAREERQLRERQRSVLTSREREILGLLVSGTDNRAIAAKLGISVNTVRRHVQSLLEKLDAHSKLEAVAKARELGILDDDGSS